MYQDSLGIISAQDLIDRVFGILEKTHCDPVMVCLPERNADDFILFNLEKLSIWECHQHWRMCGDNELGIVLNQVIHVLHQTYNTHWGQCGFRLIQNI